MRILVGIFLLLFFSELSFAQTTDNCKDETLADQYYQCGTDFAPICACDGITYRNQCAARFQGGVSNGSWTSGPCEPFYFFMYPNPIITTATIQLQFKDRGSGTMYIMDVFGKVFHQQLINVGNNFPQTYSIDATTLQSGFYFLLIRTSNHQQLQKFTLAKP